MSDERYVFRLYKVGIPTDLTKEHLGKNYKGDDKMLFASPYIGDKYSQQRMPEYYHKLGDTLTEEEYSRGDNIRENKLAKQGLSTAAPHRGLSVIGLADPMYSLYRCRDIKDKDMTSDQLKNALQFNDVYVDDNMGNLKDAHNELHEGKLYMSPDMTYNFGYNPSYVNLLRRIYETYDKTQHQGSGLVIASIPETALYNNKDILNGVLRGQRDFPEELVVKYLKLNDVKGMNPSAPNQEDYDDEDDYWYDYHTYKAKQVFDPDNEDDWDIVEGLQGDNLYNEMRSIVENDGYIRQGNKEHEKRAREFIFKHFGIDPDKIVSDETKKHIYNDLSSWYNKQCNSNMQRNHNIISGIKELGQ